MPTTPSERLAEVKRNLLQQNKNFHAAMKAADTKEQEDAIKQARADADLAFYSVTLELLKKNGANIESAMTGLKAANDDVKAANLKAEGIAKFLKKLTNAAGFALRLAKLVI